MSFRIGQGCDIHPTAEIRVAHGYLGAGSVVRAGALIEGQHVEIGRESFVDRGAWIGGGSCWDECAFLKTGDWFHLGWNAQVNIARGVTLGHEVGLGIETKVFTHGAYLPATDGFPVQWGPVVMGDRVWAPNAWINPGVKIGSHVVIAARSLVNTDVPSGCLYGGIPGRVLRANCYGLTPAMWTEAQIIGICRDPVLRNQMRRNGVRFRWIEDPPGTWRSWREDPVER